MKDHRLLATAAFMTFAIPAAYAVQPEQMRDRFEQVQTMMHRAQ